MKHKKTLGGVRKNNYLPLLTAMPLHHLRQINSQDSLAKKERVFQNKLAPVCLGQMDATIPVDLALGVNMGGHITQLREIGPAALGSVRTQIQKQLFG